MPDDKSKVTEPDRSRVGGRAMKRKARNAGRGPGFSALIVRTLGCADTDSNALATL
jgi:hypothetical protein